MDDPHCHHLLTPIGLPGLYKRDPQITVLNLFTKLQDSKTVTARKTIKLTGIAALGRESAVCLSRLDLNTTPIIEGERQFQDNIAL